jgi:hypothetical protein
MWYFKTWEIRGTYHDMLVICDLNGHVLVFDPFKCVFGGRSIIPSHGVMCIIVWLKRRPNIFTWLISRGLGHYNDHWDHRHAFVPTKHTNNRHHTCFKSTCQKNKTRVSCYTKYGFGDFLLMGLLYPFVGLTSCVCSTSLCSPSKNLRHKCMWYVGNVNQFLVCPPHASLESPHHVHVWKGDFVGLDLHWLWFGDLTHACKKNALALASFFIKGHIHN